MRFPASCQYFKRLFTHRCLPFIVLRVADLSNIASGLLNGQLNLTRALSFIPDLNACIKSAAEGLLKYGVTKSITIATVQNLAVQPVWPASAVSFGLAPSVIPTLLDNIGTMVRALNDGIRRDTADLAAHYLKARVSVSTAMQCTVCRRELCVQGMAGWGR